MRPRLNAPMLISLAISLVLALMLVGPALAQPPDDDRGSRLRVLTGLPVHHGPVTVTLTDPDSDGHQLGDLRTASVATTMLDGTPLGRLDATLTTTAVDVPSEGDEVRISTLVFTFGEDGQDQVVVSGSAVYPAQGSTIATGSSTTRPIVGGSGRFRGITGDAISQHLVDESWVHWLSIEPSRAMPGHGLGRSAPGFGNGRGFAAPSRGFVPDLDRADAFGPAMRERAREGIRELRAAVRAGQLERRAALQAESADPDVVPVAGTSGESGSGGEEVGITRTDLGIAEPGSAPGQELGLWQYVIPARSELAPHTHAGWQIAHIVRGELEYTVLAGEGTIIRGDGDSETIGPGTYVLETGDAVIENPDLQHFGHNRTDAEVIILAATLYEQGAPLSIPLEPSPEEPAPEEAPAATPAG